MSDATAQALADKKHFIELYREVINAACKESGRKPKDLTDQLVEQAFIEWTGESAETSAMEFNWFYTNIDNVHHKLCKVTSGCPGHLKFMLDELDFKFFLGELGPDDYLFQRKLWVWAGGV